MPKLNWRQPKFHVAPTAESAADQCERRSSGERWSREAAGISMFRPLKTLAFNCRSGLIAALCLAGFVSNASAQLIAATDDFRFSYAPSAFHRSGVSGHVRYNNLFSVELLTERFRILGADRTTLGVAAFNNSFGQPCQYVFGGPEWDLMPVQSGWVFANVTVGALHGYTGQEQDKIPLNSQGTAPAAIPSIGWRYGQAAVVMSLLGNSGVLISFSWQLGR